MFLTPEEQAIIRETCSEFAEEVIEWAEWVRMVNGYVDGVLSNRVCVTGFDSDGEPLLQLTDAGKTYVETEILGNEST